MQLERKSLAFEVKATSEDGGEFEGLAACFHNVDSYGDIIAPGAFTDTLPQFLQDGFIGGINHDWDCPIGKPMEAKETELGLFAKARISDTTAGRDVKTLLKDKVISKLSIGFRTLGRQWLETSEEVLKHWAAVGYTPSPEDIAAAKYGARLLTKIRLYEFSPVAIPANGRCDITRVKSGDLPAGSSFDDHLTQVLAAVDEVTERAESVKALRAQDGRSLSEERRAHLKRLRARLDSLLEAADVKTPPGPEQLLALEAELLSCQYGVEALLADL